MRLSVLDYGVLDEDHTPAEAWQATLSLAKRAEELGYHRFWLAEHHNVSALTIASPEVLMTYLASQTSQIRIGSGGIMGLHYSPYKIAELAGSMATLFPDRIDIGLGNSTGTPLVSRHLESRYQPSQFGSWLEKLATYLRGGVEAIELPQLEQPLPLFALGTGGQSVTLAAQQGLGYVFGSFPFIEHEPLALAAQLSMDYRAAFWPSPSQQAPYFILALFVVVADTAEEAERLALSLDVWMLGKHDFNDFAAFPSPARAKAYPLTKEEHERIARQRQRIIVGDSKGVKQQIDGLLAACQADEVMVIPLVPDLANRLKVIELMADLYGKEE